MAVTSNTALRVTELDFDSIKANLKEYLRSQSEFQDFDFEGSGMSVLLDILAYNTHYMSYYMNMLGNEMFLDTAQIRSSVISHAKSLGYFPSSKKGALGKINIIVTPSNEEDTSATSLTLDKYSRFIAQDIDGMNYQFVTTESKTVNKSNGSFSFANVTISQGEVVTNQFLMEASNSKRSFNIPSANIDLTTLLVTVQESVANTDIKTYQPYSDITELTSNSTVYFIEEDIDQNYKLYFGDGVIGKSPKVGNIITCTYLDINGMPANNISKFGLVDRIGGEYRDNVTVTATTSSFGGAEKEPIESVRFRAPYAYTTQNRAVTINDYETLLKKDFPIIDSVAVWGGEDNDPVIYGKVFLSVKTRQNYALSNLEKERITDELIRNRNVVTVIPEFVDPQYAYIYVTGRVTYNPSLTSKTSGELQELVKAAIDDYNTTELNNFNATFRKSKLQSYIENADPSITGSDIQIRVQRRVYINSDSAIGYNIPFNMPLKKGTYNNKLTSFPELLINDSSGVERNVLFEEVLNAPTGINSISIKNGGYNYTSAPTVTISGDGSGATALAKVANGRVFGIDILTKGADYTTATVTISGGGGTGATAEVKFENDYGTIRSFYYSQTGEKIILNSNIGTITYPTGLLTLNTFKTAGTVENDFYADGILSVSVPAGQEIITPLRNRIIIIDLNDAKSVQIEMVVEQ